MSTATFIGLVNNAALLLALGLVYDLLPGREQAQMRWFQHVPTGLVLGAIGIVVMLTPWTLTPGVIFDTRSVLLSVSGLFFGPLPTLIAMLMTAALRLFQGGDGTLMGVAIILSSGLGGIAWRQFRSGQLKDISRRELYLFGVAVHGFMLLCTFLLPWPVSVNALFKIGPLVILIYPIGTMLLGILLSKRLARQYANDALQKSEERYRTTLMSIGEGVVTVDAAGKVEMLNPVAEQLTGWQQAAALGHPMHEAFQAINDQNHRPATNPDSELRNGNSPADLTRHTLLIAPDHTELAIVMKNSPILQKKTGRL